MARKAQAASVAEGSVEEVVDAVESGNVATAESAAQPGEPIEVKSPDPRRWHTLEVQQAPMIYAAIVKVMGEIGAIAKSRKNQQQGFLYRGIDDVYNACSGPMARAGVFTTVEIMNESREIRASQRGGELNWVRVKLRVRFNALDGSFVETISLGEAMDSGDKAAGKAMSYGLKYAFFQVFCIAVDGMDPDAETHSVEPSREEFTPNSAPKPQASGGSKPATKPAAKPPAKQVEQLSEEKLAEARKGLAAFEFGEAADKWKNAIVRHRMGGSISDAVSNELFFAWAKRLTEVCPENQTKYVLAESSELVARNYITKEQQQAIFALVDERLKNGGNSSTPS